MAESETQGRIPLVGAGWLASLGVSSMSGTGLGCVEMDSSEAAVIDARPLPFTALPRPARGDLAKELLSKRDGEA
jgi:putative membrane protein